MATLDTIVSRVRTELADVAESFVWQTTATDTNRYEIPYSPIQASTAVVTVGGVDVSADCEIEEHTGILTLDDLPTPGATILVAGAHFRFFTDTELQSLTNAAFLEHTYNRQDAFGRGLTLANLAEVEEYPLTILATIQALYTLATDASFDIDIHTPDGVMIPRSDRYRQLMNMIEARRAQYNQLCQALNIGMDRIEVFTFRRISKTTNRYVPVFLPQEVDDRTQPKRGFLPLPTYGTTPIPSEVGTYDIVMYQGDAYTVTLDFDFDLTGKTVEAQARLYPEGAVVGEFTVVVENAATGVVTLSMTPDQTQVMPLMSFWDCQVITAGEPKTFLAGQVFCQREITQ